MNVRFFILYVSAALFFISFTAAGQDVPQKKFVRIEIAKGGLHCPILGPQLKEKLSRLEGAENITLNTNESYITLNLPAGTPVKKEELAKMASDLGYPEKDISVSFTVIQNNPENINR